MPVVCGFLSRAMTSAELRAIAAQKRREADEFDQAADVVERAEQSSGLTAPADNAYIANMGQAQIADSSARQRGAPLKSDGPVARVAKILGVSGADVAWLLKVNYQTSRAWDLEGRRVPDDVAPRLDALVASPKAIAAAKRKLEDRPKSAKKK